MKIPTQKINNYIHSIPKEIRCFLIYGVDSGLIVELTNKIVASFIKQEMNPELVNKLDASDILKDQIILESALLSNNLFVDNLKKVIIINNCTAKISNYLSNNIKYIDENTLLILTAEELLTSNSLRKLAESRKDIAAIACYHDNKETIKHYIENFLKAHNYIIKRDALIWLAVNLGNDRLITNQELNKLMLYKDNNKTIELLDVINVITNNSDLVINDIINYILTGNSLELYPLLKNCLLNIPAIVIIRSLNNAFKRLLTTKILLQENNSSINDIVNKLKPPVLFMHLNQFKNQLSLWNINNINIYLKKLIDLELFIKNNPNLAEVSLNKLALDIKILLNNIYK